MHELRHMWTYEFAMDYILRRLQTEALAPVSMVQLSMCASCMIVWMIGPCRMDFETPICHDAADRLTVAAEQHSMLHARLVKSSACTAA